jgi:signal transduction histidine kinase
MLRTQPVGQSSTDVPDQFFSLSLDLFGLGGTDGYFQRLNPAFTCAFGYTEAKLLGAPFISFVHLEDRAATAVPSPEGDVFAAAREVTERKVEEEQAGSLVPAQAGRARAHRDDFLVSVAHDLQQPLALIRGQVQLIQRHLARGETVEAARLDRGLGCVNAAVIRMRGMLEEMLDNALEQAGQPLRLLVSPTELVTLIRQAVSEHQLAFESHQFLVAAEASEVWAMVDGKQPCGRVGARLRHGYSV